MGVDDNGFTGRSPCLDCYRVNEDKNRCAHDCAAIEAFRDGYYIPPPTKDKEDILVPIDKSMTEEWIDDDAPIDKDPASPEYEDLTKSGDDPPADDDDTGDGINKKEKCLLYKRWCKGKILHPKLGKFIPIADQRKADQAPEEETLIKIDMTKYPEIVSEINRIAFLGDRTFEFVLMRVINLGLLREGDD